MTGSVISPKWGGWRGNDDTQVNLWVLTKVIFGIKFGFRNMKTQKYQLIFLSLSVAITSCDINNIDNSQTESEIVIIAKEKNIELPPLPWHMINIWWNFNDDIENFYRFDVDISIDRNISEDYNLYISPVNSAINGGQLYAGIQTNIGGFTKDNTHTRVRMGKGGIFSRWSKDKIEPMGFDYVDMFDDGLWESSDYEGSFCSIRRPFFWSKGLYTLSLVKEDSVIFRNETHTWVSFEIKNKTTSEVHKIGRLLFEGETLQMRKEIAAFIEIYGTEKKMPELSVTFGYPRINNINRSVKNIYALTPNSGIASSPKVALISTNDNDITVFISPKNLTPQSETAEIIAIK
jgi:hypothetical protein